MPELVLTLDVPQLLNLLLAVVFPVAVGLVTTKVTSSTLKAVLLATISLASGLISALLTAVLAGVPFDLIAALLTGLAAWIIALATHLGFWKPTGVTEKVQAIGSPSALTNLAISAGLPGGTPPAVTGPVSVSPIAVNRTVEISGLTDTEIEAERRAEQASRATGALRRDLKGD